MKDILLSWKGVHNNIIFTEQDANDSRRPWKYLRDELLKHGYDLKTLDDNNLENAERILFIDEVSLGIPKKEKSLLFGFLKKIIGIKRKAYTERAVYNEAIALGLREKMVLLLWEPAVVDPDNYTEELYDKFNIIITWNDTLVDDKKFYKFYHPYTDKVYPSRNLSFEEKKMLVNISMNKQSSHKNDLYRKRKQSIIFFEKALPNQFDLFGYYWEKPISKIERVFPFLVRKYRSYRGVCEDKNEVLARYKFSLCYENIMKENGWVTEKIFDCFQARTIPIYWGADNITDFVPENTFIDRRKFKSDRELLFFITSMTKEVYNGYINSIEEFITSEKYKLFLPEAFASTIIKTLKLK